MKLPITKKSKRRLKDHRESVDPNIIVNRYYRRAAKKRLLEYSNKTLALLRGDKKMVVRGFAPIPNNFSGGSHSLLPGEHTCAG